MELKPGDVVTLKSGGHSLTVVEVNEDAVSCLWMGNEGDLFRETLPLAVLERADVDDEDEDEHVAGACDGAQPRHRRGRGRFPLVEQGKVQDLTAAASTLLRVAPEIGRAHV